MNELIVRTACHSDFCFVTETVTPFASGKCFDLLPFETVLPPGCLFILLTYRKSFSTTGLRLHAVTFILTQQTLHLSPKVLSGPRTRFYGSIKGAGGRMPGGDPFAYLSLSLESRERARERECWLTSLWTCIYVKVYFLTRST